MNSENATKALPSREEDWPHDTAEYTFALRALHVVGNQMRGDQWPADPKDMFENDSLPRIAEALRKRCASGQAWAMVQLPTGGMFKIKRETADLQDFSEALLQGKIAVNSDWIESEDFRPLARFEGTEQWLFIETRAIERHPNAFDGVEINRDPLTMPFWSFGMAAVWIMCASPDAARHYWNGPIEAAMVEPDPDHPTVARVMTFEMAQANLMSRLAADEITATAISPAIGKSQAIEPSEWRSLTPRYRDERGGLELYFDTGNGGQYAVIRLLRDDVLQLWPKNGSGAERAADTPETTRDTASPPNDGQSPRRGRPSKYDWPSFLREVIRIMDENGDFDPSLDPQWYQSKLEDHMSGWCALNWGIAPKSEGTIRAKVVEGLKLFREGRKGQ
jgi:hypothetical protein